jgi:hypothetical protein
MGFQTAAQLPSDVNAQAIMVLAPQSDAVVASVTAASSSVAIPTSAIVEIACLTAVHFRFGSSGVTASAADRLLPAGAVVAYSVPGQQTPGQKATHIAFIKSAGAADGLISVGALL